jgi:hypothetical protein
MSSVRDAQRQSDAAIDEEIESGLRRSGIDTVTHRAQMGPTSCFGTSWISTRFIVLWEGGVRRLVAISNDACVCQTTLNPPLPRYSG